MSGPSEVRSRDLVLALLATWTVAVAKPVLDVVGRAPEYWTANRIDTVWIVGTALTLTLAPPLIFGGIVSAIRRAKRLRSIGSLLFTATLAILVAIAIFHTASLFMGKSMFGVACAGSAALVAAWQYWRSEVTRRFVSYCSVIALAAPATFLFFGPTSTLIRTSARSTGPRVTLRAPVVMIVFDELNLPTLIDENGEIDKRLFPNFHRIASTSTWYQNASVNYGQTERSVPSLLTGRFQTQKAAATSYKQSPDNLFTLVHAPDGVFALEPATRLCPPAICGGEPRGIRQQLSGVGADLWLVYQNIVVPDRFRSSVRPIPQRFHDLAGAAPSYDSAGEGAADPSTTVRSIEHWFRRGHTRSLVFLHFELPHAPYVRNPDGSYYTRTGSYEMRGWNPATYRWRSDAQFFAAQALQRYMLQTMAADRMLGILLDSLASNGRLKDCTVIVTADHGVAFTPGRARRAVTWKGAEGVVAELNAVPLFWKSPGQQTPKRLRDNAELVDVLPTLLEELGSSTVDTGMNGRSLISSSPRNGKYFAATQYPKDVWPEVLEAARRIRRELSVTSTTDGVFFVQPSKYAALVGRDITDAGESSGSVELDNPLILQTLAEYRPDSADKPNFLRGRLLKRSTATTIAVVLNGRIADVVDLFLDDSGQRFSSVFDPSLLKPGANTLQFCEVTWDQQGSLALSLLGAKKQSFSVVDGLLVNSSGKPMRRDQARLVGGFDTLADSTPGMLHLKGWLGDRNGWVPASAFLVDFRGIRQLLRPTLQRPGLASVSERMTASGFDTYLMYSGRPFELNDVTVYVIFDDSTYAELENEVGVVQGGPQSTTPVKREPAAPVRPVELSPVEATRALFARLVKKELGAESGNIELRPAGILIHPGTTPTVATFRLGGEKASLRLRMFIAELDAPGKAVPQAGNVNVEIFVDGKSAVRCKLDRNSNEERTLDVSGANELTVRVDNANGKAWWDWFMLTALN
ncbi:MAG: sulfatase-like hydrolase/transferase [Thermoanaerobaculia bacterium]|jgi:hypothetical protein